MPAYQQSDAASAKRMFERDKDILREVGIPIELVPTDAWEAEQGYRISADRYYLPDSPSPRRRSGRCSSRPTHPGEDGEAEQAFHKLSTAVDDDVLAAMAERPPAPGVDASGPHLGRGRRRPGAPPGAPVPVPPGHREARATRDIDPYALVFRRGHWYLVRPGPGTARAALVPAVSHPSRR